jgi:hypothetical protein
LGVRSIPGSKLQRSSPVSGSRAITRLKGVQAKRVPSTSSGVSSKALVSSNFPFPSATSPVR